VFFFQLAEQLGPGPLVTWGERFGAGARTGLDLGEEGLGQLATPGSMQRLAQRPWQNSDTHHLAVGQGPITATPLQVARWLAAIANGGDLVAPRVFLDDGPLSTTRGHDLQRSAEKATRHVSFRPASLAAIREGLERTITDPEGTAHASLALCWPPVAGKTGTAEVGGGRPDHAWFAGYTPVERPEWAIVVALEEGGNGSTAAAPLARRIGQALGEAGHIHDREQTIR
jgi:penicillin-binding protein 2